MIGHRPRRCGWVMTRLRKANKTRNINMCGFIKLVVMRSNLMIMRRIWPHWRFTHISLNCDYSKRHNVVCWGLCWTHNDPSRTEVVVCYCTRPCESIVQGFWLKQWTPHSVTLPKTLHHTRPCHDWRQGNSAPCCNTRATAHTQLCKH